MVIVTNYIDDVLSGKIPVGKFTRLAIERHLSDLERQNTKDFPYYFDEKEATRKINIVKICRHTKGEHAGKFFRLQGYQAFIYWVIFGWKRQSDGKRRFKKAYIEIARKNGKTEMLAPVCLDGLIFDGEQGSEVYTAATKKDQANILFNVAKTMCKGLLKDSQTLRKQVQIYRHAVVNNASESHLQSLGADSNTLDGLNVQYGIIDEYHAHPNDGVLKILETGTGARLQPLILIITTAGFNRHGPCYILRSVVCEILEGIKQDETTFGIIFHLDEDDDWNDPELWVKANPGLGSIVSMEFLKSAHIKAVNEGASAEVHFLTKHLNKWVDAAKTWIPLEVWRQGEIELNEDDLKGRICYGGLDVSSTRDLTSYCLLFPPPKKDGKFIAIWRTFCPFQIAEKKADTVGNYREWMKRGELIPTPLNAIDYNQIKAYLENDAKKFSIQYIGFDPHNATQLVQELMEENWFKMEGFRQGFLSMSAPTKETERMIVENQLLHNNSKLNEWQLGNVQLVRDSSPADNVKIVKKQDDAKIDSMVALIMAIGTHYSHKDEIPDADIYFL